MTTTDRRLDYTDKSRVYDALSDPRRRYVLRLLSRADDSLGVRELAERVAEWEREDAEDADDADEEPAQVEQIRVSLYHNHLPRLSKAGIVRYNREENQVTLTESIALDAVDLFDE